MSTLEQAVAVLHAGGVIAYPTETVYGLGCDPADETAVLRILQLKQRPPDKGLILIGASSDQFAEYIDPAMFERYPHVLDSWPGPNTWLLPCKPETPHWLCGKFDTLAVRVIDHPVATELCRLSGGPLVSTSANPAGREPAINTATVKDYFPSGLDLILEGRLGSGTVSAIRDARTQQLIR